MTTRSSKSPVCHSWFVAGLRATRPWLPACAGFMLLAAAPARGADVDLSRLPPPAAGTMDFSRDIRPIFEQSCFRCHGQEKPKSDFRLITREAALKGGDDNTNDIVPGDSAHSRLIQYVAGVDPDVQMPPPGRAPALTPEQIGRLRAWIDQGASWGATNAFVPSSAASISPALGWVGVTGNRTKFRELEGTTPGWNGGLEEFSLEEQNAPDTKLSLSGHYLAADQDVLVKALYTKLDVGFIDTGFETWRKYYDDRGGFYQPFSPPSYTLNRDLFLDTGRAWLNLGLTLPKWPQVVLGYEYQFKDGTKSMLEWGAVSQSGITKNIYPASKDINESVQILKLDLSDDLYGWHWQDNARVEFYTDTTRDQQSFVYTTGPAPESILNTKTDASHIQGANTFQFAKQLKDWWRVSGGYLYSRYNGDSSMNQTTTDTANNPVNGQYWSDQVTLNRTMNDFSLATLLLPLNSLTLSLGVQCEFSTQQGFGNVDLETGDPNDPISNPLVSYPASVQSDLSETRIQEDAQLRYTRIPYTILFAEGRFWQDSISQFEQEDPTSANGSPDAFARDTDYFNNSLDCRAGFDTSPWRWLALNAHYRRSDSDSSYNNLLDTSTPPPPLPSGDGYSAFITHRDITTDEAQAKLVLHPSAWLKTALTYQWVSSVFDTSTDPGTGLLPDGSVAAASTGGQIQAGTSRANVYSLAATVIPAPKWYFAATFSYSDSRIETWAQNVIPTIVVPYEGYIYSLVFSGHYAVNARTSFQASYLFSLANYSQNNYDGLPLGLDYTRDGFTLGLTRTLTRCLDAALRYRFYYYNEPNTGGVNDFIANGIFGVLTFKWP
jgi:hypothetical protein